jgi:hypothetical protein
MATSTLSKMEVLLQVPSNGNELPLVVLVKPTPNSQMALVHQSQHMAGFDIFDKIKDKCEQASIKQILADILDAMQDYEDEIKVLHLHTGKAFQPLHGTHKPVQKSTLKCYGGSKILVRGHNDSSEVHFKR